MRVLIIVFLIFLPLLADKDEHKYEERHLPLDVSYLNLSKDQYQKFVKIVKEFKHDRKDFHEQEEDIQKEIKKLFLSDNFNRDEFVRLTNMIKNHSVDVQADFFVKIHQMLTPDQKKHFVKYMKEWEVE